MANIIPGAQLSCYKTIAISLGQSKKENNNGVKSNFIVLSVKNKKSLLSGTRRIVLFDEDIPGALLALRLLAGVSGVHQGRDDRVRLAFLEAGEERRLAVAAREGEGERDGEGKDGGFLHGVPGLAATTNS